MPLSPALLEPFRAFRSGLRPHTRSGGYAAYQKGRYALTLSVVVLLAAAPPSGRPPVGPLQRYDPKIYDVRFEVTLNTMITQGLANQRYHLADTPIVMPVIFQGAYSTVLSDSLKPQLWLEGRTDARWADHWRVDDGYPYYTHLVVMPVEEFHGSWLRWRLAWRVQVFSSRLTSEQDAAAVPWPRQWPDEVLDGLQPQMFIESDDPFFKRVVEQASAGSLRLVPPYLAAKDLVRYCISHFRTSGDGVRRGNFGVLRGLQITGARRAAAAGRGGPHDLVCICVATLRAAGIPARPVIGIQKRPLPKRGVEFVSWAEFYLPEVGWVPFDPDQLRRRSLGNLDVRRPWPEFGTMKDLNDRVPLAYHFMPAASVETPQYPAVWGWDPRPWRDPSSEQQIRLSIISRGRGVEDPG